MSGARFCPQCGARLREGAHFCPNCGTRLKEHVDSHQEPAHAAPPQPEAGPAKQAPAQSRSAYAAARDVTREFRNAEQERVRESVSSSALSVSGSNSQEGFSAERSISAGTLCLYACVVLVLISLLIPWAVVDSDQTMYTRNAYGQSVGSFFSKDSYSLFEFGTLGSEFGEYDQYDLYDHGGSPFTFGPLLALATVAFYVWGVVSFQKRGRLQPIRLAADSSLVIGFAMMVIVANSEFLIASDHPGQYLCMAASVGCLICSHVAKH